MKQQPETAWLKQPHSQVLQQALQKCRYPQGVKIRQAQPGNKAAQVWLPKIGWMTFICHRPLEGIIKFATVRRRPSGKYLHQLQRGTRNREPKI